MALEKKGHSVGATLRGTVPLARLSSVDEAVASHERDAGPPAVPKFAPTVTDTGMTAGRPARHAIATTSKDDKALIPMNTDEFTGDVAAHATRMGVCRHGTRVIRIANAGSASEIVGGMPSIAASTMRRTGGKEGVPASDAAGEEVALTLCNAVVYLAEDEFGDCVGVCLKLVVWVGLTQGIENSAATCADVNAVLNIRACVIAPKNVRPPFAFPS